MVEDGRDGLAQDDRIRGREFKEETCRDTSLSSSLDCDGGHPALGFGSQPISTRADQAGTADYTLTTTTGLPAPSGPAPTSGSTNIPSPQVEALIEPAGGVVTPATTSTQGPLTILSGSLGFDPSGVWDYLANATQNGRPMRDLA